MSETNNYPPTHAEYAKTNKIPTGVALNAWTGFTDQQRDLIMQKKLINGELIDFLAKSVPDRLKKLEEWKSESPEPQQTTSSSVKNAAAPIAADGSTENDKFVQKLFLPVIAAIIYKLPGTSGIINYGDAVEGIKNFHTEESKKFDDPFLNIIGIADDTSKREIKKQGIDTLFGSLFTVVPCEKTGMSQYDAPARDISQHYQRCFFGYAIKHNDAEITKVLEEAEGLVIKTTALRYAEMIGDPVAAVEVLVKRNFTPVIKNLRTVVYSTF